ncbi:MAG TPA: EamA family transporter, partial [Acidimicrobiales bacterium]
GSSMVTYLIPVVAVVLGVVVLGEQAGWNLIVGGAVVIGGVTLTEGRLTARFRPRRHDSSGPEPSRPVDAGPDPPGRLRRS